MGTSRDDSATLIVALLVILALLAAGVVFVSRKAASFRAMAAAQQAQAFEMEARVRAEAARAEEESLKSDAASGSARDELPSASPGKAGDQTAKLREALDRAAAKLEQGSVADSAAAASIHAALGQSYFSLGDLDAAEKHLTAALVLHVKVGGEDSPDAAADRENLAKVAAARSRQ